IDCHEIAPDLRQSGHIVGGQDLIEGRMEAPDSRTSGHLLAGEYAVAVNATRPYAGADDKHDAVIEYDVCACCKQFGLPSMLEIQLELAGDRSPSRSMRAQSEACKRSPISRR